MAKKKIYQLDTHTPITSTDVVPISDDNSGDGKKVAISALSTYFSSNLTAIPATSIGAGSISNTEFSYLDGVTSAIQTQIDGKANTSHTHSTTDITNLSSYTGLDTRYYTETETDTLLGTKQATLVSGTNIKTVNGSTLLGSGNIVVGGAVDSVNGQTGVVVLDADDISDSGTTNKWSTTTEKNKLGYISVTQAVDLDTIETNSNNVPGIKTKTDFISVTQAVDLDTIESNSNNVPGIKTKTDFITVTQAVDLDSIETNSNASKVKTDFITVTQAVDLDTIETNSNASKVKTDFITVTQAVNLDTIESDTATNNAKVTNATHTGEVTGSGALTLDKTAITNRSAVIPDAADYIIFSDTSDSGNLKKGLVSDLPGGGGGGTTDYDALSNKPIINLVGTIGTPIDLDTLFTLGTYKISGVVSSANGALVTGVDALILQGDTYIGIYDVGGDIYQLYHLLVPVTYYSRAYSGAVWSAVSMNNYIIDDGLGNSGVFGYFTVADNTYGAGWDGSFKVPTENAVYDKIQSLAKGDVGLGNVDNTSDATKNAASVTLTNKTVALGSNTITGTKAQFNTAVTDGDIMYLDSADTITAVKTFSTAPVFNALPSGSAVASAATASTIVTRDANANITTNNLLEGYATTATAAGNTTLTVSSTSDQYFTGSTTQTVTLPVTSTLTLGHTFWITNLSTGLVTINSSGGNAVYILAAGTSIVVSCILTSGTTAASWTTTPYNVVAATGKKLTVNNTITLAGTDTRVYTFPTTNATIARTDAAQTFTGVQTMTSPSITTSIVTGSTTLAVFNTIATTVTAFGAATTMTIGGTPTTAITHNYSTNATATGNTKTVNIGTGGVAGSTTNINIGSSVAGTTTISSPNVSLGGITGASTTGTIELGHATDTTLSRSAAGVLAVEGVDVPTISSTSTLTNKTLTSPVINVTSDATGDIYYRSAGGLFTRLPIGSSTDVLTVAGGLPTWAAPSGGGSKEFRITIPGEVVQDTSNSQGLYFLNSSGSSRTISNVAVKVATAAGTTCSVNVYKSSGTDADGLNTNAVALFSSAIALGTGYSSLTNAPNTATVENGRWLNVRVTSSTGTPKASDLQIVITYT